jgi:hypothetical protein
VSVLHGPFLDFLPGHRFTKIRRHFSIVGLNYSSRGSGLHLTSKRRVRDGKKAGLFILE